MVKPRLAREYLGGVAVYSVPMTQSVIPAVLPGLAPAHGTELGRLVQLDTPEVGVSNAKSWFIARAHRLLRQTLPDIQGVIAYFDFLFGLNPGDSFSKRLKSQAGDIPGCVCVAVVYRSAIAARPPPYSKSGPTFRTAGRDNATARARLG